MNSYPQTARAIDSNSAASLGAKVEQQSEISRLIGELTNAISHLEQIGEVLEKKLDPVLQPLAPAVAVAPDVPRERVDSPLGRALDEFVVRVQRATRHAASLNERTQL